MSVLAPFQLLEVNVISAQDLEPACRKMRTYAVVWVHQERKLSTRVDTQGHANPTWNDKFVFRVDDSFLYSDTSAVMIEIYALHWFRDIHVGTVRVLVGNLIPHTSPQHHHHYMQLGMRFVALQVRRQSGRPQGILNIGVALLDSSMRSMPLYMHMGSSAVGYRHLMGEEDPFQNHNNSTTNHHQGSGTSNPIQQHGVMRPELRRTRSDTSSMVGSELRPRGKGGKGSILNGSMINGSIVNGKRSSILGGSIVNGSDIDKKKGMSRGSSMLNGSDIANMKGQKKASSLINFSIKSDVGKKGNNEKQGKNEKNEKHGSIVTRSEVVDPPNKQGKGGVPGGSMVNVQMTSKDPPRPTQREKNGNDKNATKVAVKSPTKSPLSKSTAMSFDKPFPKLSGLDFGSQYKFSRYNGFEYGLQKKNGPFWTDSELGPSPSEVAAAVAKNVYHRMDEGESSIVGGWSLDGSVEGLESKLERWLPPLYDRGEYSSYESSMINVATSKNKQARRHTEGSGLFSCFSNICGCQCSIVCGGPGAPKKKGNKIRRSPSSMDNFSFL